MAGRGKNSTYKRLFEMAKEYGVNKNALFLTALEQYVVQQKVIDNINSILSGSEDLMTTKEYVKGRENVYSHPLVKELPKHSDAANRTAALIMDIIKTLGHKKQTGSKLESIMDDGK